jgi:hypothetical protein
VADEILLHLALPKSGHPKKCRCLMCRWRTLSEANDLRLRFNVEKSLLDRTIGLPAQAIDMELTGKNGEAVVFKLERVDRE